MFTLGKLGLAIGAGVFVVREIERKADQRRNDPEAFRGTGTSYGAGLLAGGFVLALVGAQQARPALAGTAPMQCKKVRGDLWRCTEDSS